MTKNKLFWLAITSIQNMRTEKKNLLIKVIFEKYNSNWEMIFNENSSILFSELNLNHEDQKRIEELKLKLNIFISEYNKLSELNIDILPIVSKEYPKTLKQKLKLRNTPSAVFICGDKNILNDKLTAVVGARTASSKSLKFTTDLVKDFVYQNKVIVSGYAKGIDRTALESALDFNGKSIIVLPQGILTFKSGILKFRKEIESGKLLILSTYKPDAQWSVALAMARNSIIYGLAEEIYVAESNFTGGTWAGVLEGLKRGDKIYVRVPDKNETNANTKLLELGAIPFEYNKMDYENNYSDTNLLVSENISNISLIDNISLILKSGPKTAKQINDILKTKMTNRDLSKYLITSNKVELIKSKPYKFSLMNSHCQFRLFDKII